MAQVQEEARSIHLPKDEPLISAKDVAEIVGMSPQYIYTLARTGKIPHYQLGNRRRFRMSEVRTWLADARSGGANGDAGLD